MPTKKVSAKKVVKSAKKAQKKVSKKVTKKPVAKKAAKKMTAKKVKVPETSATPAVVVPVVSSTGVVTMNPVEPDSSN